MEHCSPEPHPKRRSFLEWKDVIAFGAALWQIIGWIWSSIIVGGLLVGILVSFLVTGTTGLPNPDPRTWFIIRPFLVYPFQAFFGVAIALIITFSAYLAHRASRNILPPQSINLISLDQKNRQRMVTRVRSIWITGVLQRSLHEATLIALDFKEHKNVLANPWHFVLEPLHQTAQLLPENTSIIDIYHRANGELLILGEPGSGKTTLLLELARHLLEQAENNVDHPIPVVFNLVSWTAKRQSLEIWLAEELKDKYQVPLSLGQLWVRNDQILPLLDGLDEVDSLSRATCVNAINTYKQERGLLPTVVCCRTTEYLNQKERLQLQCAVTIQPLTLQQVDTYFKSGGRKLASVRSLLRSNKALRELATTPLMLSILAMTYQGKSVKKIKIIGPPETLLQQILDAYVHRMLSRPGVNAPFPLQKTLYWLSWLAQQLKQQHQTEFYIEHLQMDWLLDQHLFRLLSNIALGGIVGITKAIELTLFYLIYLNFLHSLLYGLLTGLLTGVLYMTVNGRGRSKKKQENAKIETDKKNQGTWWQRFHQSLIEVFSYGIIFGFVNGLLVGVLTVPFHGTSYAYIYGLFFGGVVTAEFYLLGRLDLHIEPVEIVFWSWRSARNNAAKYLISALLVGLIGGLILANTFGLIVGLIIGALAGLIYGLTASITGGLSNTSLEEQKRLYPNQGIHNSLRNSISWGAGVGMLMGVLLGIVYGITGGPLKGVAYGFAFGIGNIEVFGLRNGGSVYIQHFILRLLLWRQGSIPWNYPRFLDYATRCVLLRKIGGGYIFIHNLLLDYFASL